MKIEHEWERKVILYIAFSLDGYIAGPKGEIDWLPSGGGEDYGYKEFMAGIDTILMGRKSYELILTFGRWEYPGIKTFVFTRNPVGMERDDNVIFISSDPANVVGELRSAPGKDIWLLGGGELARSFFDAGLVDEIIIAIIPEILGDGIPLIPRGTKRTALRLTDIKRYDSGVVMMWYKVEN